MTPHNSAITSVRNGTAFIGADELLAPAAPVAAASSVYGAVVSAYLGFFIMKYDRTDFFWSLCWRFQPALFDVNPETAISDIHYALNAPNAFNNTPWQ